MKAISRVMPPHVGALAQLRCMPRPSHGFAAYFAPRPPPWDDQCLLRDDALAEELATRLGAAPAIVMRANGCAVVDNRTDRSGALSWFLKQAARVEI